MKLAIGILLVLVGLFWLGSTARGWRVYHAWWDIVNGALLVASFCGVGIALILGMSWWSLLIGAVTCFVVSFIFNRFIVSESIYKGVLRDSGIDDDS